MRRKISSHTVQYAIAYTLGDYGVRGGV